MNRLRLTLVVFSIVAAVTACHKDLWSEINQLDERVSEVELLCNRMNDNINALQTIVNALGEGNSITFVAPITENGLQIGYTISFSKGQTITIYNGKEGITPNIGVRKDAGGVYYWTLNGDWLLDSEGAKIRAEGVDGRDATSPKLEIENGRWMLSIDGGLSWEDMGQATGDSIFRSVDADSDADNVIFIMADGTHIYVPKSNNSAIEFTGLDSLFLEPDGTYSFGYKVKGNVELVYAETIGTQHNISRLSIQSGKDKSEGSIIITTGTDYPTSSTAYILLHVVSKDGNVLERVANIAARVFSKETTFDYYGDSNCILIKPSETVGFMNVTPRSTSTADFAANEIFTPIAPKPVSASIIWSESTLSLARPIIEEDRLQVERLSGYGNALIGIFDEEDELLWSFHIWCPEIDPTADVNTKTYTFASSGTYEVMPLALGATLDKPVTDPSTCGLWYQWGRKDPLGRAASLVEASTANVAINAAGTRNICPALTNSTTFFSGIEDGRDYVIASGEAVMKETNMVNQGKTTQDAVMMLQYAKDHPCTFIAGWEYNGDWLSPSDTPEIVIGDKLWGNHDGYSQTFSKNSFDTKSIFDPCPIGYRVGPKDLWRYLTNKDNFPWTPNGGRKIESLNDCYPASGYRGVNGQVFNVGTGGYYWTSSPLGYGFQGALFEFDEGRMLTANWSTSRKRASLIRCVKE